jgi:hypothetical protein
MDYASDQYEIPSERCDDGRMKGTLQWHQWLAHIKAQSDERLESIFTDFWSPDGWFNYAKPEFVELVSEFRPGNLTLLMLKIAEEAYTRDILAEDDYLELQEEG